MKRILLATFASIAMLASHAHAQTWQQQQQYYFDQQQDYANRALQQYLQQQQGDDLYRRNQNLFGTGDQWRHRYNDPYRRPGVCSFGDC